MWQRTGLWSSSHFSLFVQFLIIFFQLLLGFAPPCLSFSNPTIPAWQLHTAFIAISTQPPSSCSSLQTAPKPGWPVFASQAIQGPLPWTASPERCWCRDRPSPCRRWDAGSPQELLSPQDHSWAPKITSKAALSSKSSGEGLAPSTWAAPRAQGGMPGRPDLYKDLGKQTAGLHRAATSSPKQITHKKQQLCSLWLKFISCRKYYETSNTVS